MESKQIDNFNARYPKRNKKQQPVSKVPNTKKSGNARSKKVQQNPNEALAAIREKMIKTEEQTTSDIVLHENYETMSMDELQKKLNELKENNTNNKQIELIQKALEKKKAEDQSIQNPTQDQPKDNVEQDEHKDKNKELTEESKSDELIVQGSDDTNDNANTDEHDQTWIDIKRNFWQDWAKHYNYHYEEQQKPNAYHCQLTDQEGKSLGEVHYSSETTATISKDADLTLYAGLVQDASVNNLSITFGETLDDTQKVMLLAAVLNHNNQENKKIEMKNLPTINVEADYFKKLPENVQTILKKHQEFENKKEDIRKRLTQNMARRYEQDESGKFVTEESQKDGKTINPYKEKEISEDERKKIKDEREGIRKEQLELLRGTLTPKQQEDHQTVLNLRKKIRNEKNPETQTEVRKELYTLRKIQPRKDSYND